MNHQEILNLLIEANGSSSTTRKWNIINDQSNVNYSVGNKIIYSTWVLKSDICDYNDTYILVRGDITIIGWDLATQVAFKNCALLVKCITKINQTTIDDTKDLDLTISMHNLLECSSSCSDTTGSLWFYSKEERKFLMATLLSIIILNLK